MNDDLLTLYAHNEYVQMAAELGITGLIVCIICLVSCSHFYPTVETPSKSLPVLGRRRCDVGLRDQFRSQRFIVSLRSGWPGFLFRCRILIVAPAIDLKRLNQELNQYPPEHWYAYLCFLPIMLLGVALLTAETAVITLHAWAETAAVAVQAERYYRKSLAVYPANNSAKFSYGMWLYGKGRSTEGVHYLQSAVDRGFNNSVCLAYLAGAQASAGDLNAAEQTLARAVRVYPVSVFLIVRHAAALERNGRMESPG
jgi:tetratricopeptide (TPR) repeat protein